jgi:beta-phosphoglucomutase-like phosphatase (HAD superfamily)
VVEDSSNGLLSAQAAGIRCVVTLSSYTWDEDMTEALLVVSDLGEPDAPMKIIANRSKARPGQYVTLSDLEACLES